MRLAAPTGNETPEQLKEREAMQDKAKKDAKAASMDEKTFLPLPQTAGLVAGGGLVGWGAWKVTSMLWKGLATKGTLNAILKYGLIVIGSGMGAYVSMKVQRNKIMAMAQKAELPPTPEQTPAPASTPTEEKK